MLNITDSDIFRMENGTNIFSNKVGAILQRAAASPNGNEDIVILNGKITDSLNNLKKMHSEPVILKAINDIQSGRMILVDLSTKYSLPSCLPFIRYKGNSETKILVNLSQYVEKTKTNSGEILYKVSVPKLYCLVLCAYLTLNVFNERYILPGKALSSAAYIWASMFNKILSRTVALSTNKERYDAFMYFAMKFFCIYIAQVPEQVAEDVANGYLLKRGRKDFTMVKEMKDRMANFNYKPYEDFGHLCYALFDERVTNLRGIVADSVAKEINESFYLKRFINQYSFTALFSLAAFPYFLFTVLNASAKTRIVNDMAFQDFIDDKDYNVIQLLNALTN